MKFSQLKHLSAGGEDTLYYLEGDDAYFHKKAIEMINLKFVTALPELNSAVISARDINGYATAAACCPL